MRLCPIFCLFVCLQHNTKITALMVIIFLQSIKLLQGKTDSNYCKHDLVNILDSGAEWVIYFAKILQCLVKVLYCKISTNSKQLPVISQEVKARIQTLISEVGGECVTTTPPPPPPPPPPVAPRILR